MPNMSGGSVLSVPGLTRHIVSSHLRSMVYDVAKKYAFIQSGSNANRRRLLVTLDVFSDGAVHR